jgi:hypothetical protein
VCCASTRALLKRNLTWERCVGQPWLAHADRACLPIHRRRSHIVFLSRAKRAGTWTTANRLLCALIIFVHRRFRYAVVSRSFGLCIKLNRVLLSVFSACRKCLIGSLSLIQCLQRKKSFELFHIWLGCIQHPTTTAANSTRPCGISDSSCTGTRHGCRSQSARATARTCTGLRGATTTTQKTTQRLQFVVCWRKRKRQRLSMRVRRRGRKKNCIVISSRESRRGDRDRGLGLCHRRGARVGGEDCSRKRCRLRT